MILLASLLAASLETVSVGDVDCENTVITAEVSHCTWLDYQEADAEMNVQWQRAREEVARKDEFIDRNRDDRPTNSETLLQAQRAW